MQVAVPWGISLRRLAVLLVVFLVLDSHSGAAIRAQAPATPPATRPPTAPAPTPAPATPATPPAAPVPQSPATVSTAPAVPPTTPNNPAPAAPATQAGTSRIRNTTYTDEAVILVVLILALLGLLFWLLLKWSHRLDQSSYLGAVYRESVVDFEYKRLAVIPTDKFQANEYHQMVMRDKEWLQNHPRPKHPQGFADPWLGIPGNRRPGGGGLGTGTPPPGSGPPGIIERTPEAQKAFEESQRALQEYQSKSFSWEQEVDYEARTRYERDLAQARKDAEVRAATAGDVDLSALRGRGAEFVLEFTTVVVIIFAAVVLGVLDILGTEQIGTLLAAIAGYVLGRATSRAKTTAETGPPKTVPDTK